jgi:hypothetical protein
MAMAGSGHSVYLPMIFDSGQTIRTTACLQVAERSYPESAWWEHFSGKADTPEHAFKAMIVATKRKDKAAFFKLAEPTQRSDKNFNQNMVQFFKSMDAISSFAVPKAYELGSLVVFPVQVKQGDKVNYLIFLFTRKNAGGYAFLPYGAEQMSYVIVRDWFNSKWGPAKTDSPEYCTGEDIKRATHRVSLSNAADVKSGLPPSYLYFAGASLNKSEPLSQLGKRVQSTIEEIKTELKSPDSGELDHYIKHLTPDGGKGLKEWFASANQLELENYKRAITEQHPFFLIDALPLVVVYTKSPSGSLQVMFFISNADNELLWTHSSYITDSTKIFTRGPLRDAALELRPFASGLIK